VYVLFEVFNDTFEPH